MSWISGLISKVHDVKFYGVFFTVLGLYLIAMLGLYWFNPSKYKSKLTLIRKVHYVLFLTLMGIGFVCGWIDFKDWKILAQLSGIALFMDLSVFLTPNILKIWSAELKVEPDEVEDIIKKNEKTLKNIERKAEKLFEVVKYSSVHFEDRNSPVNWRQYKDELREYLCLYTDTFQFQIAFFPFITTSDEVQLKESVKQAYLNVERCYNFSSPSENESRRFVQAFAKGGSMPLHENKLFIVSYFGTSFNCLIGIKAETDIPVDPIDASYVLNMAQMFDWWMT